MKRFMIMSIAAFFGLELVSGCSQEAKEDYDKAGEAISSGVKKDTAVADEAMDSAAVTGKVKSALLAADGIDAEHINVDTSGKTVVLKGTVSSDAEKTKAEEVAKMNVGPDMSIDNQLTVGNVHPKDPTGNNN